jgi:hypothetical protein
MRTPMKPSTMNSKQPSPAGLLHVRIGARPAPASLQSRYPRSPSVARAFRGSFDWRQYPGLF